MAGHRPRAPEAARPGERCAHAGERSRTRQPDREPIDASNGLCWPGRIDERSPTSIRLRAPGAPAPMRPGGAILRCCCSAAGTRARGGRRGRALRGAFPRPARGADAGRAPARRGHAAHRPARRDGPAARRHPARPLGARRCCGPTCSTRCFPARPSRRACSTRSRSSASCCCCCSPAWRPTSSWCARSAAPPSASRSPASRCRSPAASRSASSCRTRCCRMPDQRLLTVAVPRHRAVDLLDQDRRRDRARHEFHAPRSRPGDRVVGDHGRHDRLDHHRHHVQPRAGRQDRPRQRREERDRHRGLPGRQPDGRPARRVSG